MSNIFSFKRQDANSDLENANKKKKAWQHVLSAWLFLHKQNYEEEKAFSIKIISVTPLAKNIPSCNVHKNVALHQIAQLELEELAVLL